MATLTLTDVPDAKARLFLAYAKRTKVPAYTLLLNSSIENYAQQEAALALNRQFAANVISEDIISNAEAFAEAESKVV